MKVCWLTNIPSPYKMKMFSFLGKKIELTALIHQEFKDNRRDDWFIKNVDNVNIRFFKNIFLLSLLKEIRKCDIFVDSMYASVYGIVGVIIAKHYKKQIYLHADGGIPKNYGILINNILRRLMNKHEYFLSSSPFTDEYFSYFKGDKKNIYHYTFSSLTMSDVKINAEMSSNKEFFKQQLGINGYCFLSVGQPIKRKGFDILLKAFSISGLDKKTHLLIVGGEPTQDLLEIIKINNIKNVHFVGSKSEYDLKKYYAASDSFILCTREDIWGLVINEAVSFNLPFITSDNCVAGLHFNSIHDIGTIVKNEDLVGYSDALLNSFNNDNKYNYYDISLDYTIENTAKDFYNIFNGTKNN